MAFISGGLSAAALNSVVTYFKERRKAYLKRKFLASRLAFNLEGFAIDAYHALQDSERYFDTVGHEGNGVIFPNYEPIDISEEFELLSHELRENVFSFPDKISILKNLHFKTARSLNDRYLVEEDAWGTLRELGAEALTIAEKVRKRYKLPERTIEIKDGKTIAESLKKRSS